MKMNLLNLTTFLFTGIVAMLLALLFLTASKNYKWSSFSFSVFECGFSSYYFNRFSQSIHYFLIALIFLFLDLELCFLMPMFLGFMGTYKTMLCCVSFVILLILGLGVEWKEAKLEWKF